MAASYPGLPEGLHVQGPVVKITLFGSDLVREPGWGQRWRCILVSWLATGTRGRPRPPAATAPLIPGG